MNIRPYAWVILAINAYLFFSFFKDYDTNANNAVNIVRLVVFIFGLTLMNTFFYVINRIVMANRRECPACAKNVKRGLTICPTCNFDFKTRT